VEQLGEGAVAARIGYLLERHGIDVPDRLRQHLPSSYTKLDPTKDSRNPNARWKLYVNVDLQ